MQNELIECFLDTRRISQTELASKTKKTIKSSKIYEEGFTSGRTRRNNRDSCEVTVEENTSFVSARKYLSLGRVAVLNFANPANPGGGVQHGAMAQEECLCRSSNLYEALISEKLFDDYYRYHRYMESDLFSDRLIYTKNVTVFKDDSTVPHLLPKAEWSDVDVITCAAPYLGRGIFIDEASLKEIFKCRIKNIFEAAIDNKVDCLILGAFGCGAFRNPPEVVASAFKEVIEENEYRRLFDRIVFAIKRSDYPFCKNISAFEEVFFGSTDKYIDDTIG